MIEWFVFHDGAEHGPFSQDEFVAYVKNKDPARVQIWRRGLDAWVLAKNIPSLAAVMKPGPAAAPPPLPASVPERMAVPVNDSIAEALDESPRKKSTWSWAGYGALAGILICAVQLALELRGLKFEAWSGSWFSYNLGRIFGTAVPLAILGLIAGAVRDFFRKEPAVESVALEQSVAAQLAPAEPASAAPVSTAPALAEPEPSATHRFNNVLARHWRGELPLWVSYWVVSLIGNFVFAAIPFIAIAAFQADTGYYPPAIFAAMIATWIALVIVTIWQMVGVWRSARRYKATRTTLGRHKAFGWLAQTAVVLGTLLSLSTVVRFGIPQLHETYRIAFQGDPDIPPYSIRVMREGTEAEIIGGFKYGLAEDFSKILRASAQIKIVHLDSLGGRIGEGKRLFELIREKGLNTYVSSNCMSACTLAFAGGRERFLAKGATLGFHKGAFPGISEGESDRDQTDIFRRAGFDRGFIVQALATPHKDMWRPPADILLKAKVVTNVVERNMFATSGFGELTKEGVAEILRKSLPFFDSLKQKYPEKYDILVSEFYDGHVKGKTETEMIDVVRGKVMTVVKTLLPLADDDVLVDLNKILTEQYVILNQRNPTFCYLFASGSGAEYTAELPDDLLARERELYDRVIKTAAQRPESNADRISSLWATIRKGLDAKGVPENQLILLDQPDVEPTKHRQYCDLTIQLYREIGGLPQQEAAVLMREVTATK